MTVKNVFDFLNKKFPFDSQAHWDNSGFLVGDINCSVTKALVTLDITQKSIEKAKSTGCNLIISHHPVIFHPLENVMADSAVYSLISNSINAICVHTPLDLGEGGVNDALIEAIGLRSLGHLCQSGEESMCRVGETQEVSPADFAQILQKKLKTVVRFNRGGRPIKRVAVCGGAGGEFYTTAIENGCDAFVTGEVKHHEFILASQKGITIFEAGHYETEIPGVIELAKLLEKEMGLDVILNNEELFA